MAGKAPHPDGIQNIFIRSRGNGRWCCLALIIHVQKKGAVVEHTGMYIKDFTGWNSHKQDIDKNAPVPTFKEREIWWCSIGVNVGHEIDGKNRFYNRPVLVVRKFNTRIFWGVPLTTQVKDNPFYLQIDYKGHEATERKRCVMLSHLRLYDSKRLHDKMGRLPPHEFQAVRDALKALL